jgi:hypothetical protein
MSKYLVVAHQTANSPALMDQLKSMADEDPRAEFSLVVPKTRIEHLLTWTDGEVHAAASRTAAEAHKRMLRKGLRVANVSVGDESPLQAIADALDEGGPYAAIVISTLPPGISRWLRLDVQSRARQRFNVPIVSVVATGAPVGSSQ